MTSRKIAISPALTTSAIWAIHKIVMVRARFSGEITIFRWFSKSVRLDDATEEDGSPVAVTSVALGIGGSNHRILGFFQIPV
ncbi:hypothetical protein TIFTF001_050638 [Ficus carica]|uniref:Uncharacterized protein n=1 Tax=Ficus carica TaxID=3494 RepID=A0AA87ZBU0_FICCA|nr:hypothetical protein TIFTF001_050635 [Ficus carica]GMN29988.1 hypothetical protein TIFTF001_050636 [Ficus carica]GMN30003.1 hypothetical protein TIFTF001_050637 [Ficus carica]GMN30017.1 hypothetical protein TIFTF001_050638 [Ficus carica]